MLITKEIETMNTEVKLVKEVKEVTIQLIGFCWAVSDGTAHNGPIKLVNYLNKNRLSVKNRHCLTPAFEQRLRY